MRDCRISNDKSVTRKLAGLFRALTDRPKPVNNASNMSELWKRNPIDLYEPGVSQRCRRRRRFLATLAICFLLAAAMGLETQAQQASTTESGASRSSRQLKQAARESFQQGDLKKAREQLM